MYNRKTRKMSDEQIVYTKTLFLNRLNINWSWQPVIKSVSKKFRLGLPATRRTTRSEGSNCRMAKGWCFCHSSKACRSISISFSKLHFFRLHKIGTLVLKGRKFTALGHVQIFKTLVNFRQKWAPGNLTLRCLLSPSRATITHFLAVALANVSYT